MVLKRLSEGGALWWVFVRHTNIFTVCTHFERSIDTLPQTSLSPNSKFCFFLSSWPSSQTVPNGLNQHSSEPLATPHSRSGGQPKVLLEVLPWGDAPSPLPPKASSERGCGCPPSGVTGILCKPICQPGLGFPCSTAQQAIGMTEEREAMQQEQEWKEAERPSVQIT